MDQYACETVENPLPSEVKDYTYKYFMRYSNKWENLALNGNDLWTVCMKKFSVGTNIRMFYNGILIAVIRFSPKFYKVFIDDSTECFRDEGDDINDRLLELKKKKRQLRYEIKCLEDRLTRKN